MVNPLASIILITWNRLDYTKLCLQSILAKTVYQPYELIVVDNSSTDGTVQYLTDLHHQGKIQKLILLDDNYGAGYAMNRGLEQAEGKYLIRTDNDMVYNRGWLTALVDGLEQIPRSLLQVAVFGELVADGRRGGFTEQVNGVRIHQVPIGGCNMALTRESFEELGLFTEEMFAEDGVYCHRAKSLGYVIGQVDAGVGTHIDEPSCKLSRRYGQYAEERYQRLEELRREGYDFLWEEDRKFYREYRERRSQEEGGGSVEEQVGGVGLEMIRESRQVQRSGRILYITSGMEQNYPHQFIDNFIAQGMESFQQGMVFRLNTHIDWQTDLFGLIEKARPDYIFTLHGSHLSADCVARLKNYGAKIGIWLVDDPYDLDESKGRLSGYDYIFTNEEACVPIYQEWGYSAVNYLPLGAAEGFYYPEKVRSKDQKWEQYQSDLCFVGSPFPKRVELFRALAFHLPELRIKVVGPFWDDLLPRQIEVVNHHVTPEEIRKYYNHAQIVLNIHREYNEHLYTLASLNSQGVPALSPNNRIFEIAACQGFQLVDARVGLGSYYDLERELVTYHDLQDLVRKIRYYLKHPAEMRRIAKRGYQRTLEEHLMWHRLEEMFRLVGLGEVARRGGKSKGAEERQPVELGGVWRRLAEGRLVKGERAAVYFVLEDRKYLIPDIETFERLQLRWEDVVILPQQEIDLIVDGGGLDI